MPKSKAKNLSVSSFSSSGSETSDVQSALSYFDGLEPDVEVRAGENDESKQNFADIVRVARKQLKEEGKLVYKPGFFNKPLVRAFLTGGGALAGVTALSLALGLAVPVIGPLLAVITAGVGAPLAIAYAVKTYKDTKRINANKAATIANRMRIGQTNADLEEKVRNITVHRPVLETNPERKDFFSLNLKDKKVEGSEKSSFGSNFDEASTVVESSPISVSGSSSIGSASSISPSDSASNIVLGSSKHSNLKSSSATSAGKGKKNNKKLSAASKKDAEELARRLGGFCYHGAVPTNDPMKPYTSRKGGWGACSDQGSQDSSKFLEALGNNQFPVYTTGNSAYSQRLLSDAVEGIYKLVDKSTEDVRRKDNSNIRRRNSADKRDGWGNRWNIDAGGNTESILIGNKCSGVARAVKVVNHEGGSKEICWNKDGSLSVKQENSLGCSVTAFLRPNHKERNWSVFVRRCDQNGYLDSYDHKSVMANTEGILDGFAGCVSSAVHDVERGIQSVKFYNSTADKTSHSRHKRISEQSNVKVRKSAPHKIKVKVR